MQRGDIIPYESTAGETKRRAKQIWRWCYADDCWAGAPEDTVGVQYGFSPAFCEKIRGIATFDGGLALASVARAKDGTRKLVFKLTAGEGKCAFVAECSWLQVIVWDCPAAAMGCQLLVRLPQLTHTGCAQTLGASIEAVLIPVLREGGTKPRITICVSSQASGFHSVR